MVSVSLTVGEVDVSSTVSGMMTTLRLTNTDPDGNDRGASGSWEKADAIGQQLGEMALDAVEGGETVTDPVLAVRSQQFFLPIENRLFQTAGLLRVMQREQFNFDESDPIDENNQPDVQTEVNVIDVGPLQLLSIPGEMLKSWRSAGTTEVWSTRQGAPLLRLPTTPQT